MPVSRPATKPSRQPVLAFLLLLVAAAVWGRLLWNRANPTNRHLEAGVEYARQKQGPQAEHEWQEAARLAPHDPRPWQFLSGYYQAIQRWPDALESLQRLAQLQPNAPHLYAGLAACYLALGDELTAYHDAEESLKREPDDPDTILLFCGLLAHTGEDQRRLALLRHLVQIQPGRPAPALQLAEALVSKSLYTDARPFVEQALQHEPNDHEAHALRGMILFHMDPTPAGLAAASADFHQVEKAPRFAPFAQFHLGKILKRQGKPLQALPYLEASAQSLKDKREVYFELADAYAQAGHATQAAQARHQFEALRDQDDQIVALDKKCAVQPGDFTAQLRLTRLLLQRGDLRRASIHLDKASALRPNDADVLAARKTLGEEAGASPFTAAQGPGR